MSGLPGHRRYGTGFEEYRDHEADDVVVIVQIEHIDAVRNMESILAVEGVAGFFVGPYDLSGSLGHPGDFEHPDVKAALAEVEQFITPDGPVAGTHVVDPDVAKLQEALDRGYRFVAFASEMLIFSNRIGEISTSLAGLR